MKQRSAAIAGIGLASLAAAVVLGMPVLSRGDVDSRLSNFGVPDGAEVIAAQANAEGEFVTVVYRDASGETHTLGGVARPETPPPN